MENEIFFVYVRASRGIGSETQVRPTRSSTVRSFSTPSNAEPNAYSRFPPLPPGFRDGVHAYRANRHRASTEFTRSDGLPQRVCRLTARSRQGSLSSWCSLLWQYDGPFLCAPLCSHPHYWYCRHEQYIQYSIGESRSTSDEGGRCWKLFPDLGGDGTKISPSRLLNKAVRFGANLSTL